MEKRSSKTSFSVWNHVQQRRLESRVEYVPYYRQNPIPDAYRRCQVWVEKHAPESLVTGAQLASAIDAYDGKAVSILGDGKRHVLFFVAYHPYRMEGNSVYEKQFLDYLRKAGFIVHLLYYEHQRGSVTDAMRAAAMDDFEHYHEVPVVSQLVGRNQDGMDVHVDDWCGAESLDFVESLCERYDFETCIANYVFLSAIFEVVPRRTRRVLITLDKFADRNRQMLAEGYRHSRWVSLTREGESLGCSRADVLIAIQQHEAEHFRELTRHSKTVVVIPPIFPKRYLEPASRKEKLRIGYFGSSNCVNETNLAELVRQVSLDADLASNCEFVVAGGVSRALPPYLDPHAARRVSIRCLGPVDDLQELFRRCDVIANPERGGTGMKLKTVQSLAYGAAVVCTKGGATGLDSPSRFHAAESFADVATLLGEIVRNPTILDELRNLSRTLYDRLFADCHGRIKDVLTYYDTRIPDDLARFAGDRERRALEPLLNRVDLRRKTVLEIGPENESIRTALLKAHGAAEVVSIAMQDWHRRLPKLASASFGVIDCRDVVVDATELEHFLGEVRRLLKPDGSALLQFAPLGPSPASDLPSLLGRCFVTDLERTALEPPFNAFNQAAQQHDLKPVPAAVALTAFLTLPPSRTAQPRKTNPGHVSILRSHVRFALRQPRKAAVLAISNSWQQVRFVYRHPRKAVIRILGVR